MGISLDKILFSTSFLVSLHLESLGGFSIVCCPTRSPRFCSDSRHNTENRTMGYRNLLYKEGNDFFVNIDYGSVHKLLAPFCSLIHL